MLIESIYTPPVEEEEEEEKPEATPTPVAAPV